ncbi:MAG: WalW protein [Planctomycetes bacterium]|nr:WalW protein [Planctomycetota bacterium]
MAPERTPASAPREQPPRLIVLIAVEEEFDWRAGFQRSATAVTHLADLEKSLSLFESRGVKPTGLLTYPVVEAAGSSGPLHEIARSGRMDLGAHLHPWVTPPFTEELSRGNSFPGNLPAALEEAKVAAIRARIEESLGLRPRIYQAGRYGLGPNTYSILVRHGFLVSMSASPPFDFRAEGGPDFSAAQATPSWVGPEKTLLELPVTGGFVGRAGRGAAALYRLAKARRWRFARLPALFARAGLVERMRLSPEGHSAEDLRRLTLALRARGVDVFTLSFHSPSLKPGCTSYVRSAAELARFLDRCRAYLDFFLGDLGGLPAAPLDLRARLLGDGPAQGAAPETRIAR